MTKNRKSYAPDKYGVPKGKITSWIKYITLVTMCIMLTGCSFSKPVEYPVVSVGDIPYASISNSFSYVSFYRKPIEWDVVEIRGDKALLVSHTSIHSSWCIDSDQDSTKYDQPLFEDFEDLMDWLNGEWIYVLFGDEFSKWIVPTPVTVEEGEQKDAYLFLLTKEEIKKYYSSKTSRIIYDVETRENKGHIREELWASRWFFYDSKSPTQLSIINSDGSFGVQKLDKETSAGIRAAMWVDIDIIDEDILLEIKNK